MWDWTIRQILSNLLWTKYSEHTYSWNSVLMCMVDIIVFSRTPKHHHKLTYLYICHCHTHRHHFIFFIYTYLYPHLYIWRIVSFSIFFTHSLFISSSIRDFYFDSVHSFNSMIQINHSLLKEIVFKSSQALRLAKQLLQQQLPSLQLQHLASPRITIQAIRLRKQIRGTPSFRKQTENPPHWKLRRLK